MRPINWGKKVVENYRERIIVDPNNPILAFKAIRDRYTNVPSQKEILWVTLPRQQDIGRHPDVEHIQNPPKK